MSKIWQNLKEEIGYLKKKTWTIEEVGKFWDSVTGYDDINERTYSYRMRFVDGFRLSDLPDKSYVLDICARTGNGTLYFWQKGKVRQAVCADVTEKMQDICQKNLSQYNIDFSMVIFKNYLLPFADNEFEAILCFETIEHLPQPEVFIKELSRVLKPGGQMVLTTPNILWEPVHWLAAILGAHHSEGPHRFLRRKKIVKFLKNAGFTIKKEETTILIPGGPKFLIKLGNLFEKIFKNTLMPFLGLRRIFVCEKS